ncbi:VWA domain-containing protein [Microbacterium sp. CFH 90308]|uniref:VWA domain-containing protein n=1 Tax=Microbacterium salsuginis TaxID=2722803 RepID=A0ABX1KFS7_9MICO|nr:vWA domain-containing protein [Microbacterium sp. CFH 90308]NLP85128.1 VWA domain-containing protein [Microbacterium sp. CFH 90308]
MRGTPLRRRPKQLDAPPQVFDVSLGSAGLVMPASGDRAAAPATPGGTAAAQTDEAGTVVPVPDDTSTVDPAIRARARQIAARLAVPRARRDVTSRRGVGELLSVPYRAGSDEIDLDRTIEVLAERPVPDDEDIIVRERVRTRRSVVLLVDVSGSMRGERIRTAAATVGALAGELHRDALAVIAFWSDAALLLGLGDPVVPDRVLDALLRLPARGLTNVGFPLELAGRQLARVPARDARVLLLSDCVHNAGPDPRPIAARLSRLDVLLDISGEHDLPLGRELAARGRGVCRAIRTHRDVAPALGAVFSG